MKKTLLSLFAIVATASALMAQPVLTGATNNPVPGDVFYGNYSDTTLTPGAPGPSATWNFSTLPSFGGDTTVYVACASTPYCDSFPGSNIASASGSDYIYGQTSATMYGSIGAHQMGINEHLVGTWATLYYPLTYGRSFKDTFSFTDPIAGFTHAETDSMIYDAYGTLTTPTGTFNNVVRVHTFRLNRDSDTSGFVSNSFTEDYNWFVAGFHNPLLTYNIDTSGGNYVEYYSGIPSLAVPPVCLGTINAAVYPNPATDAINLSFTLPANSIATATLSDLTGRTLVTIGSDKMTTGTNEISFPASNLPAGIYIVRLQSAAGNFTSKVLVAR